MLEKTVKKNFHERYVAISRINVVGRKIISIFFCFGCATQNKALDMMKLVWIFFFVIEFIV